MSWIEENCHLEEKNQFLLSRMVESMEGVFSAVFFLLLLSFLSRTTEKRTKQCPKNRQEWMMDTRTSNPFSVSFS